MRNIVLWKAEKDMTAADVLGALGESDWTASTACTFLQRLWCLFGISSMPWRPESSLQSRTPAYLEAEFRRVYGAAYAIQSFTISDWNEREGDAAFLYALDYHHYNRDPDTVEAIRRLKETVSEKYFSLYDEYPGVHARVYELRVVDQDGVFKLFQNVSEYEDRPRWKAA